MLRECMRSILANDHESFEVVVVDQSEPVHGLSCADARVRVIHTTSRGKTRALNIGLREVRGTTVLFTDDDCTVPPTWISSAAAALSADQTIGLLFAPLLPTPHDATKEFVPAFVPASRQRASDPRRYSDVDGRAGANLAASVDTLRHIGEFDELIGPGAKFSGLEEFDYAYRSLCAGRDVVVDTSNGVLHWGARPLDGRVAAKLMGAYNYGEGAVLAKHIRCGDRHLIWPTTKSGVRRFLHSGKALLTTGKADGLSQAWRFTLGVLAGLVQPLDRRRRLYQDRSERSREKAAHE